MDYITILEDNGWSLLCENSATGGDDYEIVWLVVASYMSKPYRRVLGSAPEFLGAKGAIDMALKTTEKSSYDYLYEYTGD